MVGNRWFQMKWPSVLLDVGLEWFKPTRWSCQIRVSLYLMPGVYKDKGTHKTEAGATGPQAEAGRSRKDRALGTLEAVPLSLTPGLQTLREQFLSQSVTTAINIVTT